MVNDDDTIELEDGDGELPSNNGGSQITYIDSSVTYSSFFRTFISSNRPCIVKLTTANTWESAKEWVSRGFPNFAFLRSMYGSTTVPVADCGEKYYNVQKKCSTVFADYLNYWENYIANGYPCNMPCLYLKDWHFTRDFPNHTIYRVPNYFASDWLNEFYSSKTDIVDDYRFVYMGPKGSWTPLHADVFTSFSWSINICGQKRWLLFPPGQENHLRDKYGNLVYDATSSEVSNPTHFPDHHKLTPFEVIQEAGEAIFVPTGWHHQVWNVKDTISINHNWVNGCNIEHVWKALQSNLSDVKKEIADCQDMEDWADHCQLMLQAVFGMNYEEFYKFIRYIASRRLDSINNNTPLTLYGGWKLGIRHILFDLQQIGSILKNFLSNTDVQDLKFYEEFHKDMRELMLDLEETLKKASVR